MKSILFLPLAVIFFLPVAVLAQEGPDQDTMGQYQCVQTETNIEYLMDCRGAAQRLWMQIYQQRGATIVLPSLAATDLYSVSGDYGTCEVTLERDANTATFMYTIPKVQILAAARAVTRGCVDGQQYVGETKEWYIKVLDNGIDEDSPSKREMARRRKVPRKGVSRFQSLVSSYSSDLY